MVSCSLESSLTTKICEIFEANSAWDVEIIYYLPNFKCVALCTVICNEISHCICINPNHFPMTKGFVDSSEDSDSDSSPMCSSKFTCNY